MKIKDSTFFGLLLGSLFFIVILHMSLKNLLREPIFRSSVNAVHSAVKNVQNMLLGESETPSEYESRRHIPLADSKQELMDYIKSNIKQIHQNEDIRVKASNYFSPFHQSDMHNEETDLSKYFEISQPVPETVQAMKQLQCNRIPGSTTCKEPIKPATDNLSGNPMYFDQGSNGNLSFKPDIWTYENERPMNGGVMDGIRGQDSMQTDYSVYASAAPVNAHNNFQSAYPYMQSSGSW